AARRGLETLVVSTDAAHSLADALDVPVGSSPTRIAPHLDALEIDVNVELSSHWGVIQEFLTRFMTFKGVDEAVAEEMAILPGMEELFSLLKVKRFAETSAYDLVVIDCAPTGETVRMLGVPEILNFYFKRIFPIQRTFLRSVRPVAKRVTDLPLPSDDVLSAEARSVDFDRCVEIQGRHLAEARRAFEPLPFFEARLFDREMVGLPLLDEFGRAVFGDTDPAAVLFREKPVEVKKEGRGYALYIRLPFAEKEKIQVWTRGEELVVQVDNQRRHVLLPRTLASRRLLGAAFADQRLRVAFGEKEAHGAS